jgi:peptide/nickel transport system permease protein
VSSRELAKYAFWRLLGLLPVLFGILLLVFLMVRAIPGNPVRNMLGQRATADEIAKVEKEMGLDRPVVQQFGSFVTRAVRGDLGKSLRHHVPVTEELGRALPATIELTLAAFLIACPLGVMLGGWSALKKGTAADLLTTALSLSGISVPIFWLGLLFILVFSVGLEWLPFGGRTDLIVPRVTGFMLIDSLLGGPPGAFWDAVKHLVLPAVTLSTVPLAIIARMSRSCALQVLSADYVRTARAKGLPESAVLWRHVLPNAILPVITVAGLQFGYLLGGAVLTEHVFSWPGLGSLLLRAISERDYPVIQSAVLVAAVAFALVNLLVDLLYASLDPRVSLEAER